MNALLERYHAMSLRERRILLGALASLAITLVWIAHDWQRSTHRKLDASLPRVAAQLAAMQTDAAEIARLRGVPAPATPKLDEAVRSLTASAAAQGITLTVRSDGNQVFATGKNVAFDSWIVWLGETTRSSGLRLTWLDAVASPGGLQVEARFAPG